MSAREDAIQLLPENFDGWDCDGSASVCDKRLDALRALLAETEPEWEYAAGYEGNTGFETRWFSMDGSGFTIREAAEGEVIRYADPLVVLVRRRKAGPWEEVPE